MANLYFTCIDRCWRGIGTVRAVGAVRRAEAQLVRLGAVGHRVGGAAVVLVGAELAEGRSGAVARLLAVVVVTVRGRGHRQGRGLLRLVQAVVAAWGNLVGMHIGAQVLKDPGHRPVSRAARTTTFSGVKIAVGGQTWSCKCTSNLGLIAPLRESKRIPVYKKTNKKHCTLWLREGKKKSPKMNGRCVPLSLTVALWLSAPVGGGSAFMSEWEAELLCTKQPMSKGLCHWLHPDASTLHYFSSCPPVPLVCTVSYQTLSGDSDKARNTRRPLKVLIQTNCDAKPSVFFQLLCAHFNHSPSTATARSWSNYIWIFPQK